MKAKTNLFHSKKLLVNIFFLLMILVIIILLKYGKSRIHIFGSGVIKEDDITFGLISIFNWPSTRFYELNTIYTGILEIISLLILVIGMRKLWNIKIVKSTIKWIILMKMLIYCTLFLNYENLEHIPSYQKNYSKRFFSKIDDSIETDLLIKFKVGVIDYSVLFYGSISQIISFIIILASAIKKRKPKIVKTEDHLIFTKS